MIDDEGFPTDSGVDAMFTLVPVLVVVIAVVGVVLWAMNVKKAADAGVNPFTMETEAITRLIRSEALAPEKTIEERLAHLDDLRARGVITTAEHATARAEAIKDL